MFCNWLKTFILSFSFYPRSLVSVLYCIGMYAIECITMMYVNTIHTYTQHSYSATHINTEATEKVDTDILLFSLASHTLDREPLYSHKAIDFN